MPETGMTVLGSPELAKILGEVSLLAVDVGARGGFARDLLPLAASVDARGFEPDPEECRTLNEKAAQCPRPWRSLRFVPCALGRGPGSHVLHLTHHRGASSLLSGLPDVAGRFSRGGMYKVEGEVTLQTEALDEVVEREGWKSPDFLKIDVEGFEGEVFAGSPRFLDSVLGVRCEVAFLQVRQGQPVYGEIDACLRSHGLVPMGFSELHHWRPSTRVKHPWPVPGPIPYSLGQIAHGDMLFLRDPFSLSEDSEAQVIRQVNWALLAVVFGYLDHARQVLFRPRVQEWLAERCRLRPQEVERGLGVASRFLLRRHLLGGIRGTAFHFRHALVRMVRGVT